MTTSVNPLETANAKAAFRGARQGSSKPRLSFTQVIRRDWELYSLVLPGLILIILFNYIPMSGILMAFQRYTPSKGIWKSSWVGMKHFSSFFKDPFSIRLFKNTFLLGFYTLVFGFPAPIMLALMFNELKNDKFKKIVQTISYMPHFISTVIIVGLIVELFGIKSGIVNDVIETLGGERVNFIVRPEWFRTIYVGSGIWQGIGFSSIIYLAAISGVDPQLYESAVLDGAGRFQRMKAITLPAIAPTIQILLIFAIGGVLGNDFQKVLLMYKPETYRTADVISTYVYRKGLLNAEYSFGTAVGLFMSLISLILILATNFANKKIGAEYFM